MNALRRCISCIIFTKFSGIAESWTAGQALKFWEIRLRGSRVNVGLNLRVPVTPDFQHPLAAKLCVRPENVSRRENMLEVLCHDAKFIGAPTSLMGSQTC